MLTDIYRLLPHKNRRSLVPMTLIILSKTLLELVGIAVILPVFYLFVQPDAVNSHIFHRISALCSNTAESLILIICCTVAILVLKTAIILWLTRIQNRFLFNLYKHYSSQLLVNYYNRGFMAVKEFPASDFAYKINSVCLVFVNNVLAQAFGIAADSMILIFILIFAFILSPVICIAIIACAVPTILLYTLFVKKKIVKYGRLEFEAKREQFSTITNTFRGYPEMVVNNVFPVMQQKFNNGLDTIADTSVNYTTYRQIPSYLMEISVVLCAGILTLVQMQQIIDIPGAIALFGVAAIKVLPSIKNIIASWTSIKNSTYSVETIKEALEYKANAIEANHAEELLQEVNFEKLELRNISFSFASRQIFSNFSLILNKGEKLGIRGVSGRGKSTLFNIMLGLYPMQSGMVLLNGKPLMNNLAQWNNICGYVPQDVFVMDASIAENIALDINFNVKRRQNITLKELLSNRDERNIDFFIEKSVLDRLNRVIELARLKEFVDSLPHGIYTVVGDNGCKLSGGQKQRLGIARALFKNPQLLFFDEATSALNNEMEAEITNAIENITLQNRELTVVIIAHRESSLRICDRIIDV